MIIPGRLILLSPVASALRLNIARRSTTRGPIYKCQLLWRTDDALGVRFVERDIGVATPIEASTTGEPTRQLE